VRARRRPSRGRRLAAKARHRVAPPELAATVTVKGCDLAEVHEAVALRVQLHQGGPAGRRGQVPPPEVAYHRHRPRKRSMWIAAWDLGRDRGKSETGERGK
jgi:hypothetical protein